MAGPLDTGLNVAILQMANQLFPLGFDVADEAPATYEELTTRLDAGNRMVVFSGGSDHTIYGDPEINACFRAWHDWCHWRGRHDLTFGSEQAVAEMQAAQLLTLYGNTRSSRRWADIIRAEVIGQAEFYRRHKLFPDDQYGFIEAYLKDPEMALSWSLW
jgi:hypothetical protein